MGINLGAFLGQLIVPIVAENVSWHLGFGMAAIGMLAGLIQYKMTEGTLGELGVVAKAKEASELNRADSSNSTLGFGLAILLIGILSFLQYAGYIDMTTATGIAQGVGVIIVLVTLFYFIYIITCLLYTSDAADE